MPELSAATFDRAAGVLLTGAVGDALVAGHVTVPVGAPLFVSGEWTEATALTVAVADAAVGGADLQVHAAQDRIGVEWWGLEDRPLLWAGPLALVYLTDPDALVATATELSTLAHLDPEVGQACALWGLAIRHAVLTGELDPRVGLGRLKGEVRDRWAARLAEAEESASESFTPGDAVGTLQVACSVVMGTPVLAYDPEQHLVDALVVAVGSGHAVAATVVGALLGAVHGLGAVPLEWADQVHGPDGLRAIDLVGRARALAAAAPVEDTEDVLRGL